MQGKLGLKNSTSTKVPTKIPVTEKFGVEVSIKI